MPELKPLPERLNVVGVGWTIEQSQERWDRLIELGLPDGVEPGGTGHTDYNWHIISINPDNNLTRKWITLFHEVLHVLEEMTSPDDDLEEAYEMFIEQVDTGLFVFLRDTFGVGLK